MTTGDDDKISAIEKIDGSSKKSKAIEEELDPVARIPPDKEHFDGLMQQDTGRTPSFVTTERVSGPSIMDQVRDLNNRVDSVSRGPKESVVAQATEVIKQIEEVKQKLATPNLEIKGSVKTLLDNKLSHIDESLKVALNRAGIEYTPPPVNPKNNLASPIEKFIGLLTHGQYQLQRLSNDVAMMGDSDASFTPAKMLAVQIKVGYVQQEIELFTNVLNKSLESIKTIMNVQI